MDGVLSQEEINALLNNNDAADSSDEILTESEKDAIGEIANISMGTAAATRSIREEDTRVLPMPAFSGQPGRLPPNRYSTHTAM